MQLTEDQLSKIRELAALFFSPTDVAVVMGFDPEPFRKLVNREGQPIYMAYHSGRLQREAAIRRSILDFAEKGSTPAQTTAMILLKNLNQSLADR